MSLITKLRNILDQRILEGFIIYPMNYFTTGVSAKTCCVIGSVVVKRLLNTQTFPMTIEGNTFSSWNVAAAFELGISPMQARALEYGFLRYMEPSALKDQFPECFAIGLQLNEEYVANRQRQIVLGRIGHAMRRNDESSSALAA